MKCTPDWSCKTLTQFISFFNIKIFGDSGYQATVKELRDNLIERGCIDVLTEKETTWDMQKGALSYLMFLKRKRCGN